jgi:hypothetical protein
MNEVDKLKLAREIRRVARKADLEHDDSISDLLDAVLGTDNES